jgi:osmotically-inducible protein OsmY
VSGSKVTLQGEVLSWHERESAERAAMHAPGITEVDNKIVVGWMTADPPDYDDTD